MDRKVNPNGFPWKIEHFPVLPERLAHARGMTGRHWGIVTSDGWVLYLYPTEEEAESRLREHFA